MSSYWVDARFIVIFACSKLAQSIVWVMGSIRFVLMSNLLYCREAFSESDVYLLREHYRICMLISQQSNVSIPANIIVGVQEDILDDISNQGQIECFLFNIQ